MEGAHGVAIHGNTRQERLDGKDGKAPCVALLPRCPISPQLP